MLQPTEFGGTWSMSYAKKWGRKIFVNVWKALIVAYSYINTYALYILISVYSVYLYICMYIVWTGNLLCCHHKAGGKLESDLLPPQGISELWHGSPTFTVVLLKLRGKDRQRNHIIGWLVCLVLCACMQCNICTWTALYNQSVVVSYCTTIFHAAHESSQSLYYDFLCHDPWLPAQPGWVKWSSHQSFRTALVWCVIWHANPHGERRDSTLLQLP